MLVSWQHRLEGVDRVACQGGLGCHILGGSRWGSHKDLDQDESIPRQGKNTKMMWIDSQLLHTEKGYHLLAIPLQFPLKKHRARHLQVRSNPRRHQCYQSSAMGPNEKQPWYRSSSLGTNMCLAFGPSKLHAFAESWKICWKMHRERDVEL